MKNRHLGVITAACCFCAVLTGCGETYDTTEGWHCNAYQHTVSGESKLGGDKAVAEAMNPLKESALDVTSSYMLTGFFTKDISIAPENATSVSQSGLSNKAYADAAYNDCWYFTIEDPSQYLSLSEEMMPASVRITYAPAGNLTAGTREAVIITFNYLSSSDATTDTIIFPFVNGPEKAAEN